MSFEWWNMNSYYYVHKSRLSEVGPGKEGCPMKPAGPTPRLLTAQQAGIYLGFRSAWPIRELVWKGELPIVRIGKRRIAFDLKDLDAFIATRKAREAKA
jgi:hypothetical protein